MYLTYNKGKSIVAQRSIRALKSKIYQKMTARYFYLGCLGKLGDDYKTPCKTPIHADCSAFSEEI